MKFKRQLKAELDINLAPLIDVVFLLLMFFMVTTTFTKESRLTIDLPESTGLAAEEERPEQIEIIISAQGDYAVNGRALVNKERTTLKAALAELSGGDSTLPLIITADAMTPHQAVVTAMDVAGQLSFVHLSITTQQAAAL